MTTLAPGWLPAAVAALRERMVRRLQAEPAGTEARRGIESALQELDAVSGELQAQVALLARENERYAEFFEHAPDAYLITDPGGGVREANRAALELLRRGRGAVLGRPLGEFTAGAGFAVRAIALKKSGFGALCWLVPPAA